MEPDIEPPLERAIARLMMAGVWTASACLGVGLLMVLVGMRADSLLIVGLFTLMATPILRVAGAIGEASRRRDWLTLWATLAVLAILIGGTLRQAFAM